MLHHLTLWVPDLDLTPLETIGLAIAERMGVGAQWWRVVGSSPAVVAEMVDWQSRPLDAVYPDARFVMTHRDPAQTLASICKMTFSLRSAREAGPVDPHRVGQQMFHFIRRHIDRIMQFCTGPDAASVCHVDYYRLAADPGAMLDEIHQGIGADALVDEGHALLQLLVAVDDRGLGDPDRGLLRQRLHDERERQVLVAAF